MNLSFNNPAFRQVAPDFETIELVEDLVITHPLGQTVIPKGFICDLESVPQVVQAIFPKLGKGAIPGVIHDELYRSGRFTQAISDAVYLEAMKQRKVNVFERWIKYLVLRCVGFVAWNEHRRREK